ncbi:MAG: hypothetical protein BWY15_02181 [Firmicutes bacterium ADurb.Bin193]|nr:MAG: hypothetical protein BWY15_02181 [Firmicutes bacterium ADurb.Bin193]
MVMAYRYYVVIIYCHFCDYCSYSKNSKEKAEKVIFFLNSTAISMLILWLSIFYVANNPFIYCPKQYQGSLTRDMKRDVIRYYGGVYSSNIPMFPLFINIVDIDGNSLSADIYYSIGVTMKIALHDGIPNIERPPFGL